MLRRIHVGCALLGLLLASCRGKSESAPAPSASSSAQVATHCAELRTVVCHEIGEKSGVCGLFAEPQFPESRCQAMLDNLPQTLKDLRQMEQSRLPLSEDLSMRLAAGSLPGFGDPQAKVTVVAFMDYDCRDCMPIGHYLPLLAQHYAPSDLRFVLRQYPISGGKFSKLAAEAVLAASSQGKFLPYHECLFNSQHDLNPGSLERCAKEANLNVPEFTRALEQHTYANQVSIDTAFGREALAANVPYLFVNGKRLSGSKGADALRSLIDETLAEVNRNRVVTATNRP